MGGGGGKGGGSQVVGFRYYMSLHLGLSRGEIDEITQVMIGGMRAWPHVDNNILATAEGPNGNGIRCFTNGEVHVVHPNEINSWRWNGGYHLSAPNLFGGDKKEGGVEGSVEVMLGAKTQLIPNWIKHRIGGGANNVPDFRGVTTIFYDGLITSINPYPKEWQFRARRTMRGWDGDVWQPNLATIWLANGAIKAMNPAHILYEAITNRDWGRGLNRSFLLDGAWVECAKTLHNEGLGLCMRYTRQSDLSEFISEVLDHIGGSLHADRETGKLVLGLMRGDYDPDKLPLFTYDSGLLEVKDEESATQDDLVNEVIVKWFDPIGKSERSVRAQNIASHQTLGATNSKTTSYSGVSTQELAQRLAQRDLKAGATSLKRFKVVFDRRAWKIVPTSVFRIHAPDKGLNNIVLRAGKVAEGGKGDGRITVDAMLDVFGLPANTFVQPQPITWQPPNRQVMVADRRLIREVTYAELAGTMDTANLRILDNGVGYIGLIAARPSPLNQAFELATGALGEELIVRGRGAFAPHCFIKAALEPYDNVVPFNRASDLRNATVGTMIQIDDELCRLDAIQLNPDGVSGLITLARGCVDTIPSRHDINSLLYFVYSDTVGRDGREYLSGETVEVKVLPYSSSSSLDVNLAPTDGIDIIGRQSRPYPPADVKVNGTPIFNSIDDPTALDGDTVFSWVHRDRILQQDQLVAHNEGSVGPEVGVTYNLRIYRENEHSPVRSFVAISGTNCVYTSAMKLTDSVGDTFRVELESSRDSLLSTNKYDVTLTRTPKGYGLSYGTSYGV